MNGYDFLFKTIAKYAGECTKLANDDEKYH